MINIGLVFVVIGCVGDDVGSGRTTSENHWSCDDCTTIVLHYDSPLHYVFCGLWRVEENSKKKKEGPSWKNESRCRKSAANGCRSIRPETSWQKHSYQSIGGKESRKCMELKQHV